MGSQAAISKSKKISRKLAVRRFSDGERAVAVLSQNGLFQAHRRDLFPGLQETEVLLRDEIVGVEPKSGFKISLRLRQSAPFETDQSQVAKRLKIVRIESHHSLEFLIRLLQAILQKVNVPELVVAFVVVGHDPDC